MQFVTFDAEYVQRLADGDSDTERHFVSYFGELLGIKLRARLRCVQQAEEVRQEVFLRVFRLLRRRDGIRQPERLGPLVNSICDHVVLEFRRAGDRVPTLMEQLPDMADSAPGMETELMSHESSTAVRAVLETLPEREQLLLRSVYLEEKERNEICRAYGVDREYLRVLLHRARQLFKDRYLQFTRKEP